MERVAIFVDAGYLFAQGSALLFGQKRPRGDLQLDYDKVLSSLAELARSVSTLSLLRIYWYDGTSTGPSPEHNLLAYKPNLKVRLGFVNTAGQQKGVDSLVVTDMIDLARNRAIADALLLSGDEDLRVGVQQAQQFGVRVHLLGIKPSRGSQSSFLLQEADTTHEWAEADVASFLSLRPAFVARPPEDAGRAAPADFRQVSDLVAEQLTSEELSRLVKGFETSPVVPREYDVRLIFNGGAALGQKQLSYEQKENLRNAFRAACKRRSAPPHLPTLD